jgi:prolyl 4-hydroxylase
MIMRERVSGCYLLLAKLFLHLSVTIYIGSHESQAVELATARQQCTAETAGGASCQPDNDATDDKDDSNHQQNRTLLHTCFDNPIVDCRKGCIDNFEYMRLHCQSTCHLCHLFLPPALPAESNLSAPNATTLMALVADRVREARVTAEFIESEKISLSPTGAVSVWVPSVYGVDQKIALVPIDCDGPCESATATADSQRLVETLQSSHNYMINTVYPDNMTYDSFVRESCHNEDQQCTEWASSGECDENPGYMFVSCAPACQSCDKLSFKNRCPYDPVNDPDAPKNIWTQPTDLDNTFQRAVSLYYDNVQVLSKPSNITISLRPGTAAPLDGPWVITIDNFLSASECDRLIQIGHDIGYERSKGRGELQADGTYAAIDYLNRTSSTAWCSEEECLSDPVTVSVAERIGNLTQIPGKYFEFMQFLQYNIGQFYEPHHDYHDHHRDQPIGPRILTVFLYLNDVDAGGGTNFPKLGDAQSGGMTVTPKKGRALVWPSVIGSDPRDWDERTQHQALVVESGVKYSVNVWIHLRDFRTPFKQGCAQ